MPKWIIGLVGKVFGYEAKFLQWIFHNDDAWENWVDAALHDAFRLIYQTYIILTSDIANFSYYTASFAAVARHWVQWLAYERIPHALRVAVAYTQFRVHQERNYRRAAVHNLRVFLIRFIADVAQGLQRNINSEIVNRRAAVHNLRVFLIGFIADVAQGLQRNINSEIANRRAAIRNLRNLMLKMFARLQQQVNAIIPTLNQQAAAGYDSTRTVQTNLITKLFTDILSDNPLVSDIVGRLVTVLLDLLSVDDPAARLLGELLLKQVIDRLGVDKLAGQLAGNLAGELLGNGPPKTIKDVTKSVGDRLNGQDSQWSQFFANGGDDIEQLGKQMRESASPVFTLPLAAYFAAAVTDPGGTAAATDAVVTPAARAIVGPILQTLGNL